MSAPTAYDLALSLLRDLGVTSLDPSLPANQPFPIEPTDLTDICQVLTSAIEEAAQESGQEQLNQPGSAYIQAPTNVTLTVTQGSQTVSAFTTFASWMAGCTIQISGDSTDNQVLSATQLARPYNGGSTSGVTAVVFCDALTLDSGVDHVTGPLTLVDRRGVFQCSTRELFASRYLRPYGNSWTGNAPAASAGWFAYAPFWSIGPKPQDSYPSAYFMDTYYDPALAYVVKRILLTPMPTVAQSIGWTQKMLPPRISPADAVSGYTTLTASGATSDTNANQSYTNLCDINGYRAFVGVTHPQYAVYFHPGLANYVLNSSVNIAATPAAYWQNTTTAGVPLGTFVPHGTATGTVTVTSSDQPGKVLTMPNGWIENLLLPIARQQATRLPIFKNADIKAEIFRQYQMALKRLRAATVATSSGSTRYM